MANPILDAYATDFVELSEREQLTTLIEIGDTLPEMPGKTPENEIHGCQSAAYLTAKLQDNHVIFTGWADARTIRGYMALLTEAFSNQSRAYVLTQAQHDLQAFLDTTKLAQHLTPNRANSIGMIFAAMQERAKALKG